ncbi:hypothetical protein J6590_050668 [Homalodisca vitripennis]|nr:hypothetical protein J6590_050668 [Homalodisca vitripennis]
MTEVLSLTNTHDGGYPYFPEYQLGDKFRAQHNEYGFSAIKLNSVVKEQRARWRGAGRVIMSVSQLLPFHYGTQPNNKHQLSAVTALRDPDRSGKRSTDGDHPHVGRSAPFLQSRSSGSRPSRDGNVTPGLYIYVILAVCMDMCNQELLSRFTSVLLYTWCAKLSGIKRSAALLLRVPDTFASKIRRMSLEWDMCSDTVGRLAGNGRADSQLTRRDQLAATATRITRPLPRSGPSICLYERLWKWLSTHVRVGQTSGDADGLFQFHLVTCPEFGSVQVHIRVTLFRVQLRDKQGALGSR